MFLFLLISTSYPSISAHVHDIEVGFSPGGSAKQLIISAIKEAKISIDICAYSFTSQPIALAICDAQNRGVNIRIIVNKEPHRERSASLNYLANHRIPVRLNDKYQIMHHKFIIIDNNSIETGSFNYTQSAICRNAENVLYLRNRPDIAKKYATEFNKLWNQSIDIKVMF